MTTKYGVVKSLVLLLILFIFVTQLSSKVSSQDDKNGSAQVSTVKNQYLEAHIVNLQKSSWNVSESFKLELSLNVYLSKIFLNESKQDPGVKFVEIKNITLISPNSTTSIFPNIKTASSESMIESCNLKESAVNPVDSIIFLDENSKNCEITITLNEQTLLLKNTFLSLEKLFVTQPQEKKIFAKIEYTLHDSETQSFLTLRTNEITIVINPAWYSIYVGGAFGALLINILWLTFGLQNNSLKTNYYQWDRGWKKFLLLPTIFIIRLVNSAFVSIAVILLISSGQSIPLIAFKVKDFGGSIIIGLFSYPLGAWVYNQLIANQGLSTQGNPHIVNSPDSLQFNQETGLTIKLEDEVTIVIPEELLRQSLKESEKNIKNTQDS
jgi:hypothetical protein